MAKSLNIEPCEDEEYEEKQVNNKNDYANWDVGSNCNRAHAV